MGQARAAALVAACTLALLVDVGAAQEDLVHVDGRVLWIAGQTMVVAPYASGSHGEPRPHVHGLGHGLFLDVLRHAAPVGTSIATTLIARQSQFHQVHLVSRLATDNPSFQAQLNDMVHRLAAAGLGTWEAQRQAYARFYEMVQQQAQALAYIDTFWLLAIGAALMFVLAFTLQRNDPRASGAVSVH